MLDPELVKQDVIDILRVGTYNQPAEAESTPIFNWSSWFPFLSHCLRTRRFPYPQVADEVLKDERLAKGIKKSADEKVDELKATVGDEIDEVELYEKVFEENKKRAHDLLIDMRSKISDRLLRFASLVIFLSLIHI